MVICCNAPHENEKCIYICHVLYIEQLCQWHTIIKYISYSKYNFWIWRYNSITQELQGHNKIGSYGGWGLQFVNTLWTRQNDRLFPDDILKWIFLNENVWILNKTSLNIIPKGPINKIPALVQIIMAWRRPGDKPLSEPMMIILLMHICVTRHQWVKFGKTCSPYINNYTFSTKPASMMAYFQ